jgi:hypothetical protein
MITMWLRIAILILAAVGAAKGWWGWAAFWFGLVGGVTVRVNDEQA